MIVIVASWSLVSAVLIKTAMIRVIGVGVEVGIGQRARGTAAPAVHLRGERIGRRVGVAAFVSRQERKAQLHHADGHDDAAGHHREDTDDAAEIIGGECERANTRERERERMNESRFEGHSGNATATAATTRNNSNAQLFKDTRDRRRLA